PGSLTIDTSTDQTPPPATVGAIAAPAKTTVAARPVPVEMTGARALAARAVALSRAALTSTRNWIRFAIVMWVLVALALFVRLAVAFTRAYRVASRAALESDEFLRVEVERACRALGVTRWIDIALTDEIAVPMVVGVGNPRVVLPVKSQQWSRDRLYVVLLHEIAHIRRRDCASMLFARAVGSVLWFHPLVVMLSRDVRRESERACDQLVLSTGVRGSDYAEHLVSIARLSSLRDPLATSTLAFAARSTLEQRVFSILAGRLNSTSRRMLAAIAVVAVVAFAGIAALRPTQAAVVEEGLPNLQFRVHELSVQQQAQINRTAERVARQVARLTPQQTMQIDREAARLARQTQHLVNTQVQNHINYQVLNSINTSLEGADKACDLVCDKENDGEEWYERAGTYYKDRKFDKAGRAYENAARFGYNTATAFYNAGCSFALSHQDDTAIRMLEQALAAGFDDPEKYDTDEDLNSLRGNARFQKLVNQARKSDTSLRSLRAAADQYENLALAGHVENGNWNQVGVELMRAGAFDRAAEAFDNEYKESGDTDAIYNKACARALQGRSKEALDLLEQCIAAGDVDTGHMLGDPDLMSLHREKRFDELVVMANDLNLSASWQRDDKAWKGDEHKRWMVALPRYELTARRYPRIGRAWANLGFIQLKGDDAPRSVESYQKALNLGFRNPATLYNLGCASAQAGNTDAAFKFLDKAEKAGFDVQGYAQWDDDLDPLKADPRWDELKDRWQEEEGQKDREDTKKYN
ncbi:MAG TPA: M56 family metallopeptidase, partial [Candidatus Krumholzibacteria bacterium]|nr:M56 family metallopeptidase [Candidatus Krumholzibacteria bacterium]